MTAKDNPVSFVMEVGTLSVGLTRCGSGRGKGPLVVVKTREDLYAEDVIKSFLPKGVKLEDVEWTKVVQHPPETSRTL